MASNHKLVTSNILLTDIKTPDWRLIGGILMAYSTVPTIFHLFKDITKSLFSNKIIISTFN